MDLHLDRIGNIPATGWALVIAGAAFGGAVLHQSRVVGGLIVGGLAFAFELSQAPCCAACAGGASSCADSTVAAPAAAGLAGASSGASSGITEVTATGALTTQATKATAPLSNDYVGTAPAATIDPASVWGSPTYTAPAAAAPAPSSTACRGCA